MLPNRYNGPTTTAAIRFAANETVSMQLGIAAPSADTPAAGDTANIIDF